jgi:hypothetical protein
MSDNETNKKRITLFLTEQEDGAFKELCADMGASSPSHCVASLVAIGRRIQDENLLEDGGVNASIKLGLINATIEVMRTRARKI